jgi:hypothetical protein
LARFSDPCETRCHGKHGYCSFREGHKHYQLDGGSNTRRAQRYPGGLNFALAAELISGGRRRFPKGYIADVCGGSGGVAKAAISSGFPSYVFDNAVKIKDDITHRSFTAWHKKKIDAGKIMGVMLALPCSSFSLANSRSGKALRSKIEARGISNAIFTFRERERIEQGNRLLDAGINIIKHCCVRQLPVCLENPSSSFMWSDLRLSRTLQANNAKVYNISQCAFGARWRKENTVAFLNIV